MGALAERMGIRLVECVPDRVVLTMPVEGNTQPFGLLHGGANAVLVETAGSIGAAMHAGPGNMVVGLDINVTHHRSAREGTVTAVGTPIDPNTNTVLTTDVSDTAQARVVVGTGGSRPPTTLPGTGFDTTRILWMVLAILGLGVLMARTSRRHPLS